MGAKVMRSTLDDLLFTLRISQEELSADVHPDHYERLLAIEKIVRWFFEDEERREKEERSRLWRTKDGTD